MIIVTPETLSEATKKKRNNEDELMCVVVRSSSSCSSSNRSKEKKRPTDHREKDLLRGLCNSCVPYTKKTDGC